MFKVRVQYVLCGCMGPFASGETCIPENGLENHLCCDLHPHGNTTFFLKFCLFSIKNTFFILVNISVKMVQNTFGAFILYTAIFLKSKTVCNKCWGVCKGYGKRKKEDYDKWHTGMRNTKNSSRSLLLGTVETFLTSGR